MIDVKSQLTFRIKENSHVITKRFLLDSSIYFNERNQFLMEFPTIMKFNSRS